MIGIEGKKDPVIAAASDLMGYIDSHASQLPETPACKEKIRYENKKY